MHYKSSGWNNKNTLEFGFDAEGNHVIYNLDGEVLETDFANSPFCELLWKEFKKKHPTIDAYNKEQERIQQWRGSETKEDIDRIAEKMLEYLSDMILRSYSKQVD